MRNYLFVENLLKSTDLFWQYPVITEQTVYLQQKFNNNYFGLPWATIIDKNLNLKQLFPLLKSFLGNKTYSTTCQHIFFRRIISFCKELNITTIYSPHKIKNEDYVSGINIKPCPLFAVNFEDKTRNMEFKKIKNFNLNYRKNLYTFMGCHMSNYISKIRLNIFKLKNKNSMIQRNNGWHFVQTVYGKQVENKIIPQKEKNILKIHNKTYNELLVNSKFSLCPSGSGPNSIRFWESLACGTIPVLLSDTLELPKHKLWKDAIVFCPEKHINKIDIILSKISFEKESKMRKNCLEIYSDFKNNFLFEDK